MAVIDYFFFSRTCKSATVSRSAYIHLWTTSARKPAWPPRSHTGPSSYKSNWLMGSRDTQKNGEDTEQCCPWWKWLPVQAWFDDAVPVVYRQGGSGMCRTRTTTRTTTEEDRVHHWKVRRVHRVQISLGDPFLHSILYATYCNIWILTVKEVIRFVTWVKNSHAFWANNQQQWFAWNVGQTMNLFKMLIVCIGTSPCSLSVVMVPQYLLLIQPKWRGIYFVVEVMAQTDGILS